MYNINYENPELRAVIIKENIFKQDDAQVNALIDLAAAKCNIPIPKDGLRLFNSTQTIDIFLNILSTLPFNLLLSAQMMHLYGLTVNELIPKVYSTLFPNFATSANNVLVLHPPFYAAPRSMILKYALNADRYKLPMNQVITEKIVEKIIEKVVYTNVPIQHTPFTKLLLFFYSLRTEQDFTLSVPYRLHTDLLLAVTGGYYDDVVNNIEVRSTIWQVTANGVSPEGVSNRFNVCDNKIGAPFMSGATGIRPSPFSLMPFEAPSSSFEVAVETQFIWYPIAMTRLLQIRPSLENPSIDRIMGTAGIGLAVFGNTCYTDLDMIVPRRDETCYRNRVLNRDYTYTLPSMTELTNAYGGNTHAIKIDFEDNVVGAIRYPHDGNCVIFAFNTPNITPLMTPDTIEKMEGVGYTILPERWADLDQIAQYHFAWIQNYKFWLSSPSAAELADKAIYFAMHVIGTTDVYYKLFRKPIGSTDYYIKRCKYVTCKFKPARKEKERA